MLLRAALIAVTASFGPAGPADTGEIVPMIGRDGPEADGCGGIGQVSGLLPRNAEFLVVRERPEDYGRKKGELLPRTLVWLCDARDDWQGIVYPTEENQELGDCRTSSPVAAPEPYSGPCASGWIPARHINLLLDR